LKGEWGFIRGNRGNGHGRDRGGGGRGGGVGAGAIMGVGVSGIFRNFWEFLGFWVGNLAVIFFGGGGGNLNFGVSLVTWDN
jgi:hypothetical protein